MWGDPAPASHYKYKKVYHRNAKAKQTRPAKFIPVNDEFSISVRSTQIPE